MGLTKQQLEALNISSFPNNNAGAITPDILRQYNASVITNTVNQDTYSTDSASFSASIASLNNFSSSLDATFATDAQLNASSSTLQANINTKLDTASFNSYTASTNTFTASISTSVGLLQTFSGSEYKADSSSFNTRILAIISSSVPAGTVSSSAQIVAYNIFATTSSVTASINTLSSSIYLTDATQSTNITNNSASAYQVDATQSFQITANALTASNATTALSQSLFFTDTTQSVNITQASASAWGAFQSSSANSASAYQVDATQSFQITANALTASNATTALSQSLFFTDTTQSVRINSLTALTASTAYTNVNNSFSGTQSFVNVNVSGTASVAFLNVTYQSSSVIYSSGSNILGDEANIDTQTLVGRVIMTGSAEVTGSLKVSGDISSSTISGIGNVTLYSASVAASITGSSANVTTLSASIYQTDATQSNNIATNTTNIATLTSKTGSYATTGSNTFVGNQTINGNVNITGSLTASGLKYPTTDGTAGQFIITDGVGTLAFDDVHVLLEDVRYGENITLGDPLYVSGSNGNRAVVYKADAAVSSKMPVIYIAKSTAVANTNTTAITLGLITGVTTTGYAPGTTIYVAEGGGWSQSRPSGSTSIVQPLGIVTKEGPGGSGRGLVLNPGPAFLPNIQTGYTWVGNDTNQPTAVATSSFVNINQTSSFATTGSNTFNGNQIINGTLQISSSATYDLDITGGWQATAASRLSGSSGINSLTQTTSQVSASAGIALLGRGYDLFTINQNQIGLYASGSGASGPNFDAPIGSSGIGLSSGSTGVFYYPITFQSGPGYTDGTISVRTPLSASAGITSSNAFINGELYSITSASFNTRIIAAENTGYVTTASFNAYTQSTNDFTASITASYNATSSSLNSVSSSLLAVSGTVYTNTNTIIGLNAKTASYATTGSNSLTGSQIITGSLTITGSVATPPVALTISSNTASIDFSKGSIYTLTLVSGSNTYITASNITPGQTANLLVTQASVLSGSIVWASSFKFPTGSAYTGSKVASAVDLISFITVNNTTIYSVGAQNLV